MRHRWFACLLLLLPANLAAQQSSEPADLVLLNAKVWTVEEKQPVAEAVAIRGNRIIKVGSAADVAPFVREGYTRVLDLRGRLVLPGFIDNHTHFAQAGRLLLGLNLLEVNDAENFRARVAAAADRLPPGAWLVGGDWGAYAEWEKDARGQKSPDTEGTETQRAQRRKEFLPAKELIDAATADHPALISRFDGQLHLANSLALAAAGITRDTSSPEGGEILRDAAGEPSGLLRGTAAQLVRKVVPPASYEQRRAEALHALEEARRWGVTTIHDNTANFEQLDLFRDVHRAGELTSRVWARMPLSDWEKVREHIREKNLARTTGGWGDEYIQLGGLKAWVDGIMGNSTALFWEPYRHQPGEYGRLRPVMHPEGNLHRLIRAADLAGFTVTVHAIGDYANHLLLDTYERVFRENPARDRRFRVVHAQVLDPMDFPRFGKLKLVAEVQPYHCIDDMRWMEERIGDRARWSYAFLSLANSGAMMSFGSDWPGTNASYYPNNLLLGIYAAVTRQTLKGQPEGGWFRGQRISMEDAVRYFTLNNAWATFEENLKGSIKKGKLADLVVLDRDIFSRPPRELLDTQVLFTILDGRIVYEKPGR